MGVPKYMNVSIAGYVDSAFMLSCVEKPFKWLWSQRIRWSILVWQ